MGEAPHAGCFHYGFVTEHYDMANAIRVGEHLLSRMS
jgi:hypothetical protein